MKKAELKALNQRFADEAKALNGTNEELKREVAQLKREVETMRAHWRPVPMTHPWQPRNPQCALCDEPRDAARHQVDTDGIPTPESLPG